MTFKDLFLSDIELDSLKEHLSNSENSLTEALTLLNINMDTDRCLSLLEKEGFIQCDECGKWDETDEFCWDCFLRHNPL